MSSTFGDQPGDVVTSSRGDVLNGVSLSLYPTRADAVAQTNVLGTVVTNLLGRWSYTDASLTVVWVRTLDGQVYSVEDPTVLDAAKIALGVVDDARLPVTAQAATLGSTYAPLPIASRHPLTGWFHASAFGVVANGTTNNTAFLQAANDACSAAGGGVVYLDKAGTYNIAGTLLLGDNVELRGQGAMTVLKATPVTAGSPGCFIGNNWAAGNSNITLRSLYLDRTDANAQHAVIFNGVAGLVIDDVDIVGRGQADPVGSGAMAISGIFSGFAGSRIVSKNIRINNCRISRSNNFGIQLGYVNGAVVSGNTFDDCYREVIGVEPEAGNTAKNITIVGNTITSDTIDSGTLTGLIIATETSGGSLSGVSISGNTLLGTASAGGPGIGVYGGTAVVIADNIVIGAGTCGIQLGTLGVTTTGHVVKGNVIKDCNLGANVSPSGAGIELRNATHILVNGNTVSGANHTASIEETSGSADNVIAFNILRDAVPLATIAVSTLVAGNKITDGNGSLKVNSVTASVDLRILAGNFYMRTLADNGTVFSIGANGIPRWNDAGIQQTTVGAAGGASAPPATPTKWLRVSDSAGASLVIPAYTTV